MPSELLVFSHLRWTFVWQRPQQLISRLSARYDRTWFIEEPLVSDDVSAPTLRIEEHDHVTRVWLEVPASTGLRGAEAEAWDLYLDHLGDLLDRPFATVWLYTPMAVGLASRLDVEVL